MSLKSRVNALEACYWRTHPAGLKHFSSVVHVPADIERDQWPVWLAQQPCACGTIGCKDFRIGLLVSTRCQTPEEWEARYRRQSSQTPAPSEAAELTVILTRIEGEP